MSPRREGEDKSAPEDRLLTARQLADYLSLNERTVMKLVTDGVLPGVKLGNQWRFRRAMIDTWLDDQMLGVLPDQLSRDAAPAEPPVPRRMLALESCFSPAQIVSDLVSATKTGVIEELASHAAQLGLVRDKTWFLGALLERENVMPTAIGNGVAFLHTLHRNEEQVTRPFMVLGRSTGGVDFDALDGRPTHLFFVLGLKYQGLHLPWLSKLSRMFADPATAAAILQAGSAEEIYSVVARAESHLTGSPAS